MSKGILEITQEDYEEMKAKGIDDESLLKPGKYKMRRRTKIATKEKLRPSNTKVEFQMKLDLDLLKYFQESIENDDIKSLQNILNEALRNFVETEMMKNSVETKILKDKTFIKTLADEIKKAA